MTYWDDIHQSLSSLLENGFCFLPPIEDVFPLRDIFERCSDEIGERTYAEGLEAHQDFVAHSGIASVLSPALFELARLHFGYTGMEDNQYHVSRLVRPGDVSEGYRGHFDSHIFTLVMPIQIPQRDQCDAGGSLLFYPAVRNEPKSEIRNFAGKLYFKRYAGEGGFAKLAQYSEQQVASFEDSRPLLFLGRQTFHGNMPVDISFNQERLTLLSHFFDPSPVWGIGNVLRRIRAR